jgi:hypothetical protein
MMMHGAKDDDDDDDDATYDPSKCPAMKQGIRAQNQILHGPDLPTASSRRESPKTKTKPNAAFFRNCRIFCRLLNILSAILRYLPFLGLAGISSCDASPIAE